MPSIVKIAIPCVIGVSGAGVASSNAFIKTMQLVNIEEKDEEAWNKKITTLLNKLKQKPANEGLDKKIEGTNTGHLGLDTSSSNFTNESNAKTALKAWCKDPKEGKEHFDDLCKHKQKRGWLFG